MTSDAIDRLAEHLGIAHAYRDQDGTVREIAASTKRALLSILGFQVGEGREADAIFADLRQRELDRLAPPVVVLRENQSREITVTALRGEADAPLRWRLTEESGRVHDGAHILSDLPIRETVRAGGLEHDRRVLRLPDLAAGYHRLDLMRDGAVGQVAASTTVIVAPRRAYWPQVLEQGGRIWGLSVQLYGVRSARNWGIGDFTDLQALLTWAGRIGAAAIGVNPLHALYFDDASHISPYSPSSRIFINPLYIDVEAIEDFTTCAEAQALVASAAFQNEIKRVRASELVDYAGVTLLKRRVLELIHISFQARASRDPILRGGFEQFRANHGDALRRFAIYESLREMFGAKDHSSRYWRRWPPEFQDPRSPAVAEFSRAHAERVEFFMYLQWQAERQLRRCIEAAHRARLPIGLYLDLAVGTDTGGADAWAGPNLVATGATIGAPPDTFNQLGQNWGLPPLNAEALREQAFQPFVALLRANMRWAGALRIDHVLGLMRLYWIPEGATPAEGAYVAYPFDDLVGLVALESRRNHCLVIGEDLGTLPEGFQPAMRGAGLLSYCLLYFERDLNGRFRPPREYPADALASISTHDLPTLWGFWEGRDVAARETVGVFPDRDAAERARRSREEELAGLLEAFRREGLLGPEHRSDTVPFEAVVRFVARTPCRMLMVAFEDLLGVREQANLPGTVHEHPNWRRKLPMTIEAIMRDRGVAISADMINAERPPVWRAEAAS